jgi:hypothetical protein
LPYTWLAHCLESVRYWCALNQFDYQFLNDELFEHVPRDLLEKTIEQRVVATDLARLIVLKEALGKPMKRLSGWMPISSSLTLIAL